VHLVHTLRASRTRASLSADISMAEVFRLEAAWAAAEAAAFRLPFLEPFMIRYKEAYACEHDLRDVSICDSRLTTVEQHEPSGPRTAPG
jgi:hypothetical protein